MTTGASEKSPAQPRARVFVTGGSGFVGTAVINELLGRGYPISALTHRRPIGRDGVRSIPGDLFSPNDLEAAMSDCAAVIHLVGIIRQQPSKGVTFDRLHRQAVESVTAAAKRKGIARYLHMSAQGTRADAVSEYHRTKYAGEQIVRNSGLDWTIFRPSIIHGPGGELMQMEARWARKQAPPYLFMPYFGRGLLGRGGAGMLQPVFVEEVARAVVDAIEKPRTIGNVYALGGAEQVTWPRLHEIAARLITGRRRWVMALPVWYANMLTHVVPAGLLPFNRDQVRMSQEDNTCDMTEFIADFGWKPRGYEQTIQGYAQQL